MNQTDDPLSTLYQTYANYFQHLILKAWNGDSLQTLFALLRVGAWHDANWDTLEESQRTFEDFNALLPHAEKRSPVSALRIHLFMYCHAVEMNAGHVLLANLLRIICGERYLIDPFADLMQSRKRPIPPSAKQKLRQIQQLAENARETRLCEDLDFFDDRIRNAFAHSDFILTNDYIRWSEGLCPGEMSVEDLQRVFTKCFAFFGALLSSVRDARIGIAELPRFHKLPRYEVLELLLDEDGVVDGFNVHFSNGSKASYRRTSNGSNPMNIRPRPDGSIDFMIGSIDDLEQHWKVNGTIIEDFEQLNARDVASA